MPRSVGVPPHSESIPNFGKRSVYAPSVPLPPFGEKAFLALVARPRTLTLCLLFCDPLALPLVPIEACAGLTRLNVVVGTGRYENDHYHQEQRVLPVKLRKSKLWGMERISVFYGGNAAMVVS